MYVHGGELFEGLLEKVRAHTYSKRLQNPTTLVAYTSETGDV